MSHLDSHHEEVQAKVIEKIGRPIIANTRPGERHIRLIVAYDGTDLVGYQRQPADKGLTVQGCLEAALSKVCNEDITVYGSSRTDAGVHAKFQVISFFTLGKIPVENLNRALIAHLPATIVVRHAQEIALDWKIRQHIYGKAYTYRLHNHIIQDPMTARYQWHIKKPLDIQAMRKAAQALLGRHDFTTLKGANTTPVDPVKTIYGIGIQAKPWGTGLGAIPGADQVPEKIERIFATDESGDKSQTSLPWAGDVTITVVGDGFLYHMVRNIAGLLVDVGLGRRRVEDIPAYLAAKDRKVIGKTAPAQGLCLEEVFFDAQRMEAIVKKL